MVNVPPVGLAMGGKVALWVCSPWARRFYYHTITTIRVNITKKTNYANRESKHSQSKIKDRNDAKSAN
jgi:hypothetical protein